MLDVSFTINLIWVDPIDWIEIAATAVLKAIPWQARANLLILEDIAEDFIVQTSSASNSNWNTIAYLTAHTAQYLDINGNNTMHLNGSKYYRVLLLSSKRKTQPVRVHGEADAVALEIAHRHSILLERGLNGNPCYIFLRYKDGIRCPKCWDEIIQQRVINDCSTCHNTGWLYGFHDPVKTYISYTPDTSSLQPDLEGLNNQSNKQTAWTSNYPVLTTGDVIIDAKDWEVWGIDTVQRTTHKRVPTKQVINMTAFQGDDPKRILIERLRRYM